MFMGEKCKKNSVMRCWKNEIFEYLIVSLTILCPLAVFPFYMIKNYIFVLKSESNKRNQFVRPYSLSHLLFNHRRKTSGSAEEPE